MLNTLFRWLLRCFIVVVFCVFVAAWLGVRYLQSPMTIGPEPIVYLLQPGGSLGSVVYGLSRDDRLKHPRFLMLYSKITGRGQQVQAGEYVLMQGMTPLDLLSKLELGDVKQYQFVLIEGWTIKQALAALSSQRIIKQQLDRASKRWHKEIINDAEYTSPEGLFFPDTYRVIRGETDRQLLSRAHKKLLAVLDEEWQQRDEGLPYRSPYEALIMASLIEKETGVGHERAEIAGVFVRRLNKRMRLQTDPAVMYGLGEDFDGNLRSSHLKDRSNPYNTYRHHGLPPTPIALVGREAIHAALHPKQGDPLYFVAKGDGSHYFSKTLEEHRRAVRQYQINQRSDNYRSAPRIIPNHSD